MEAKTTYRVETFTPGTHGWGVLGVRGTLPEALDLLHEYDNDDDGITRIVEVTERVLSV